MCIVDYLIYWLQIGRSRINCPCGADFNRAYSQLGVANQKSVYQCTKLAHTKLWKGHRPLHDNIISEVPT